MVRRRCHAPPGRPDDSMTADGTPTEKPEITLESLQERLAINPFHQWLGLELVRVQDGLADAALALWGEGRDGRSIVLTGGAPMLISEERRGGRERVKMRRSTVIAYK